MPKATHDPTTATAPPSRRGLLTGGTAALLAGAGAVTAAHGASSIFDAVSAGDLAAMAGRAPRAADERIRLLGVIANGSAPPIRRRALYELAEEALRLAALEPPDTMDIGPGHPDAGLLALCQDFQKHDTVMQAWNKGAVTWEVGEAAQDRWWDCVSAMEEIPAATVDGIRLKAACSLRALEAVADASSDAEELARAVLRQVAAWRASA